jgi:hypothetical protein
MRSRASRTPRPPALVSSGHVGTQRRSLSLRHTEGGAQDRQRPDRRYCGGQGVAVQGSLAVAGRDDPQAGARHSALGAAREPRTARPSSGRATAAREAPDAWRTSGIRCGLECHEATVLRSKRHPLARARRMNDRWGLDAWSRAARRWGKPPDGFWHPRLQRQGSRSRFLGQSALHHVLQRETRRCKSACHQRQRPTPLSVRERSLPRCAVVPAPRRDRTSRARPSSGPGWRSI